MTRTSRNVAIAFGALLLALVVFVLVFDWNWIKGPLERTVSERTGREFRIAGNLDVDFGWPTRVQAERVSFANPAWAAEPLMLQVERADIAIELWPLLSKRVVIPHARLVAPEIDLEVGPSRRQNWRLGKPGDGSAGTVPVIGTIEVDRGRVTFRDELADTDLRAELETTGRRGAGAQALALAFSVTGTYRQLDVAAEGTSRSLVSIADSATALPVTATFRIGPTRGSVDGSIAGLATFDAVDIRIDVRGNSLAEAYKLATITLPPTPPYRIRGRLIREGEFWRLRDFRGRVGDSDLSGSADVRYRDGRAMVFAKLTSEQLDLDDLGGAFGAPPQAGEGETASAGQQEAARQQRARPTLLPNGRYKLDRLRAMDADIEFAGRSIRNERMPIENIKLHVRLDEGVMTIDPLELGIAGGGIAGAVDVDASKPELAVRTNLEFHRIGLGELFPRSRMMQDAVGTIGGRATLAGTGNSVAAIASNANGDIGLAMREGEISNMLLELAGLDGGEVIELLFGGDRNVEVRCAVADFAVNDGTMVAQSVLIDTSDTKVLIEGSIDLDDETLDLTLRPLPKDFSILSLRSAIHVDGRLKDPDIDLDKEALLKTGAAALLGALVAPLAALLPLIETGPGKNENCAQLVDVVEKASETSIAAAPRPSAAR